MVLDYMDLNNNIIASALGVLLCLSLTACGNKKSRGIVIPPVQLSVADASIEEGDSGTTDLAFTVSLDQAATGEITVDYATSDDTATVGEDYTMTTGTLTIPAGESMATITVSVMGDTKVENNETLTLTLSNPSSNTMLGTDTATGTILTDDQVMVSVADASVYEGDSNTRDLIFTVSLNRVVTSDVFVNYATSDGTATTADNDYTAKNSTLTIPAGENMTTITIVVNGDTDVEINETLMFILSSPSTNAIIARNIAIGTITADDGAVISVADASIEESDSGIANLVFTVSLNRAVTNDVTVDYATSGGTATAGEDYRIVRGTLTIPAGGSRATITIVVNGDTIVELSETLMFILSNPSTNAIIARNIAIGTITADDGVIISVANASVTEGESGTTNLVFTVSLNSAVTSDVTVDYTTSDGTATAGEDYTATSSTLTIPAGAMTGEITIEVMGDTDVELDETLMLTLSSPSTNAIIARDTAAGTITTDDGAIISVANASVDEGNAGTTNLVFTVSLNSAVSSDVTVDYATFDGTATAGEDYTATSSTLTIPTGAMTGEITIVVNGDTDVELDETLKLTLSSPSTNAIIARDTATGTITTDDGTIISVANASVTEGDVGTANLVFTVSLNSAVASDVTVDYATSDGTATAGEDYTATSSTLTIPTGAMTGEITIVVSGDTDIEGDETFMLTLSSPSTDAIIAKDIATGTITNDDEVSLSFSSPAYAIPEGSTGITEFEITLNLGREALIDITGTLRLDDLTALVRTEERIGDYFFEEYTITIPAGETSVQITGSIVGDTDVEDNELFRVYFESLTENENVFPDLRNLQTDVVIINDDDVLVSISDASVDEGNADTTNLVFNVSLDRVNIEDVTIEYSTSDETAISDETATYGEDEDYTAASGTLTIPEGERMGTITIVVNGDTDIEGDETLTLVLKLKMFMADHAILNNSTATGTIIGDDGALVSIADASVNEGISGDTNLVFTVSLNKAISSDIVAVYSTSGGTATAGSDYTAVSNGMVTISAGTTEARFTIVVNGDTVVEPDETFTLTLGNLLDDGGDPHARAAPNNSTATGTIIGDDGTLVNISDASVDEGNSDTADLVFDVSLNKTVSSDTIVTYSTSDGTATAGSDYTAVSNGMVTISAGTTSAQVTIVVTGDTDIEGDETLTLTLLSFSGPTDTVLNNSIATGTITGDDGALVSITDARVDEGNSEDTNLLFTVSLNKAISSNIIVVYSTSDGTATTADNDYTAVSGGRVTISADTTEARFRIVVKGDATMESDETFTLTLSNLLGDDGNPHTSAVLIDDTATATIVNDD